MCGGVPRFSPYTLKAHCGETTPFCKACLEFQRITGDELPIYQSAKQLPTIQIIGIRSTVGAGTHSFKVRHAPSRRHGTHRAPRLCSSAHRRLTFDNKGATVLTAKPPYSCKQRVPGLRSSDVRRRELKSVTLPGVVSHKTRLPSISVYSHINSHIFIHTRAERAASFISHRN
jgi:hypothetical protein